jgi:lactate dehydrogenase-like 2-hydroxyacid dehydrogenase
MIKVFKPASVSYWSPHTRDDQMAKFVELDQLLQESDILYVATPADAEGLLSSDKVAKIKNDSLLVTFTHGKVIDKQSLLERLQEGTMRAVSDDPIDSEEFKKLPLSTWFCFNGSNAFNTETEIKTTSNMAVESILNLLKTGNDKYKVN